MSTIWFVYGMNCAKIAFCMALEGHGVFVANIQRTLMSEMFLN